MSYEPHRFSAWFLQVRDGTLSLATSYQLLSGIMTNRIPTIVLCAAAIGLNVALGTVIFLLKAPIYLDSIGIMLVALMAPGTRTQAFFAAASVATISFVIGGLLVNPFLPWFVFTGIAGAAFGAFVVRGRVASVMARTAGGRHLVSTGLIYGIGWGVIAAIVSAPVVVYLFGGVTGSGTTLILAFLVKTGQQLLNAALLTGLAAEPIDKTLQMICALLIARATPETFRRHLRPEPLLP